MGSGWNQRLQEASSAAMWPPCERVVTVAREQRRVSDAGPFCGLGGPMLLE
jgi:hypothetical protein